MNGKEIRQLIGDRLQALADRTGDKKFDRADVDKIVRESTALADQEVKAHPWGAVIVASAVTGVVAVALTRMFC